MNIDADIDGMLSATLSKPLSAAAVKGALGRPYIKIKIKANTASAADSGRAYFVEKFTATQAFHEHIGCEQLAVFLNECIGRVFLNCVIRTAAGEVSYYTGESGKVACHRHKAVVSPPTGVRNDGDTAPLSGSPSDFAAICAAPLDKIVSRRPVPPPATLRSRSRLKIARSGLLMADSAMKQPPAPGCGYAASIKHRILPEGTPVPFLVRLGVMTDTGKVVQSKYDKFKQINRFLEYVRDAVNSLGIAAVNSDGAATPIRVVDFGCGKAYLTFAIHHYLTEVLHCDVDIVGLDLKVDVVEYCNKVAGELHCHGLHFQVGDIAGYSGDAPDLVVALHACDTATDEALAFAVRAGARAILSAPCCQHEVNKQLGERGKGCCANGQSSGVCPEVAGVPLSDEAASPFAPLLRYGLLRERFASLATDALRAEYLEAEGYNVQLLEFVDAEHTPKNLLIRAVKRRGVTGNDAGKTADKTAQRARAEAAALSGALGVNIALGKVLGGLVQ